MNWYIKKRIRYINSELDTLMKGPNSEYINDQNDLIRALLYIIKKGRVY